ADWERVLAARRAEDGPSTVAQLARLGPELADGQVLASGDEVLVRQPQNGAFAELHTARVVTRQGYRYICGSGGLFLQELWLVILLCGGAHGLVTFLADGARWLREFAQEQLRRLARCGFLLDWYDLVKKVKDRISRMGGGKEAKKALRRAVV